MLQYFYHQKNTNIHQLRILAIKEIKNKIKDDVLKISYLSLMAYLAISKKK